MDITLTNLMSQERNALSPRSLVLSLLLGMRRPRRSAQELVAWCGLFGISDGTARVALSRMARAGELECEGAVYELAGRVRRRGVDQGFALAPRFVDDGGSWWMEAVIADSRSPRDRVELRRSLRHAGYAERREGLWLRPANLDRPRTPLAVAQCERFRVQPDDPPVLARELFDASSWGRTARDLRVELRTASRQLDRPDRLAAAFVTGTKVVAHLRADPLLPESLTSSRDRGDALRDDYWSFQRNFGVAVNAWFESQ
jgi:phenylacetic acid degradation operon negative regulatory protein